MVAHGYAPATVALVSFQVYIKELRTDIQKLLDEQRANAKVYGGQEGDQHVVHRFFEAEIIHNCCAILSIIHLS